MARILIADDDAAFREGLCETLTGAGHLAAEAHNAEAALRALQSAEQDLVFLDLRMPGMGGLDALRGIKAQTRFAQLPVVIMTAYSSSENTIDAMRLGAFDHLSKPVGRNDVLTVVDRALRSKGVAPAASAPGLTDALIGDSPSMREVHKRIGMAATSDATVLITGETGTGKELVARVLHEKSLRATRACIAVNCAAIPAELLESELFGHVKGAYTGAVSDTAGCFRAAHGGSLFLDEIGDMGMPMQAKILRALQEREVHPVGASAPVAVDVRVIAATNRDLVEAVRVGRFREDLYYRLNVVPIHVPPLRERLPDLIPLARHFLGRASDAPKVLTPGAAHVLATHDWPGNVRELKNLMERLSVLVRGAVIDAGEIQLTSARSNELRGLLDGDLHTAVTRLEKLMINQALQQTAGNRAEAARLLGIRRQLLYVKLKQYGIDH